MKARRGFTLLEVLATLVLVGIVLPIAMQGATLSLSAADSARKRTEATALAEAKLFELAAYGPEGALSGDFSPEQPQYRWAADVAYMETNLAEIRVEVIWDTARGERSAALTTMVMTE